VEFVLGLKDPGVLARLRSSPEEKARLEALLKIYEEPDAHADLNALTEVLIEMDECLSLWRAHHVQMVERMIGAKRGTGGSDGVGYLQSTLPKRTFPDLWRVRTRIGLEP
jgi:tryptophan 2,3-dioxygenase